MGNAIGVSGLVGFATILLVVMAILIIVADDKVRNITGYSANNDLKAAHDKLIWAQVLAWIAAGLGLLLVIGYVALHFLQTNEWLHLILWILLFAALIASGVFLAIALNDVNRASVSDNKGADGYIWGALITGGVALLVLLISGGWRVAHKQWENAEPDMYYAALGAGDPLPPSASEPGEFPPNQQVSVTTSGAAAAPI